MDATTTGAPLRVSKRPNAIATISDAAWSLPVAGLAVEPVEKEITKTKLGVDQMKIDVLAKRIDSTESHTYFPSDVAGGENLWGNPIHPAYSGSIYRPLPEAITTALQDADLNVINGVWAEVGIAWWAIDNCLMLWQYEQNDEVIAVPLGATVTITAVALVPPRPDVFSGAVKYLVGVATESTVHLYALTFDGDSLQKRAHVRETGFSVPTDGVIINKLVGSSDGRIFLAGRDGCVHELLYDNVSSSAMSNARVGGIVDVALKTGGWIGETLGIPVPAMKRARCVNHDSGTFSSILKALTSAFTATPFELIDIAVDHHRRLLYTLASDGAIQMYFIGRNPTEVPTNADDPTRFDFRPYPTTLERRATIKDLAQTAKQFCTSRSNGRAPNPAFFQESVVDRKRFQAHLTPEERAAAELATPISAAWPVLSLHVVSPYESEHVHLIVLAASGTRFFFSTYDESRCKSVFSSGEGLAHSVADVDSSFGDVGSALTLVYIAMPPHGGATHASDVAPVQEPGSPLIRTSVGHVHLGLTLLARAADDHGNGSVLAISQDPFSSSGFAEGVQTMSLVGGVTAFSEVLWHTSPYLDPVYTPSGCFVLPDRETCVAPAPLATWNVLAAQNLAGLGIPDENAGSGASAPPVFSASSVDVANGGPVPLGTAAARGFAASGSIAKQATPSTAAAGGAISSSDYIQSLVLHKDLIDGGIAPRFHHTIRRRLWGTSVGAGTLFNECVLDHSTEFVREIVIMTPIGVHKYHKRRIIDHLSRVLENARPMQDLYDNVIKARMSGEEAAALFVALSCGATRNEALITRALDAFDMLKGVSDAPQRNIMDVVHSNRFTGCLRHAAYLLRPYWDSLVFDLPPKRPADVVKPAFMLPRWTRDEMRCLQRQLRRLLEFMRSHFLFVEDVENAKLVAQKIGVGELFGLPDEGRQVDHMPAQNIAKWREVMLIFALYRLLMRCAETAAMLSAFADPATAALKVLKQLARDEDPSDSVVEKSKLKALLTSSTFKSIAAEPRSDAGDEPPGKVLATGMFDRMLWHLKRLPTAPRTWSANGAATTNSSLPPTAAPGVLLGYGGDATVSAAQALLSDPAVALSAFLLRECPSYFSDASYDLVFAERNLTTAMEERNEESKAQYAKLAHEAALKAVSRMNVSSLSTALRSYEVPGKGHTSQLEDICDGFYALGRQKTVLAILAVAAAAAAGDAKRVRDLPEDFSQIAAGSATAVRLRCYILVIKMLNKVLQADASEDASMFFALYSDVLLVPDAMLHYTIFTWLLRSMQRLPEGAAAPEDARARSPVAIDDTLLILEQQHLSVAEILLRRTTSPYIEAFFRSLPSVKLLARYLEAHGMYGKAAEELATAGLQPSAYAVDDRIQLLTHAIAAANHTTRYNVSDKAVTVSEEQAWRNQLKALELQKQLGEALHRRGAPADVVERLQNQGPFSLQRLLDDALAFKAYDVALRILNHLPCNSEELERVWDELIKAVLQRHQPRTPEDQMRALRDVEEALHDIITGLCADRGSKSVNELPHALPLAYLVENVELHLVVSNGFDKLHSYDLGWFAVGTLHSVPFPLRCFAYAEVARQWISIEPSSAKVEHLLRCFDLVCRAWLGAVPGDDKIRKEFIAYNSRVRDLLSEFLIYLQSSRIRNEDLTGMLTELKEQCARMQLRYQTGFTR